MIKEQVNSSLRQQEPDAIRNKMERVRYLFGESAPYFEGEKEEAEQYLLSWKKFLLRRLERDCYNLYVRDEQWIHRGPEVCSSLCQVSYIALKLSCELEMKFDMESQSLGQYRGEK